jgi:hypothetical protein
MLWRSRSSSPVIPQHPAGFIESCLPTNARTVPAGSQWAYEIKHDGFRFICRRDRDRVRVFCRRGHEWTERVPRIVEALSRLRVKSVTLDGEGVVCRADGVSVGRVDNYQVNYECIWILPPAFLDAFGVVNKLKYLSGALLARGRHNP